MRNVQELDEKVKEEIVSFARLHSVTPDQVVDFWGAVEIRMGKDTSDKTDIAKRADAVRFVARNYPYLHLQLRQKLLAEATLPNHEKRERAAIADEEKRDYDKFLYKPLEEAGSDA